MEVVLPVVPASHEVEVLGLRPPTSRQKHEPLSDDQTKAKVWGYGWSGRTLTSGPEFKPQYHRHQNKTKPSKTRPAWLHFYCIL